MTLISVIIPNYNCELWLAKTLDSCLIQKEFLNEIVVVDDFSTDSSWNLLVEYREKFPDLIKILRNPQKGGNNARNYGFGISTGQYIQWLDADDQIEPDKFSTQLEIFRSDSSIDLVYSDWSLVTYDTGRVIVKEDKRNAQYDNYCRELLMNNWSAPHCYLVRRGLAQKLNDIKAWNPDTVVMQDREYFTIAAILGAKFSYVPGSFAIYNRWNFSSVSAAKREVRYKSLEKILSRFEELIRGQNQISGYEKYEYQNIINTEKLLIKAAGFPAEVKYGPVRFKEIKWRLAKGIRTNLRLAFLVFKYGFFRKKSDDNFLKRKG